MIERYLKICDNDCYEDLYIKLFFKDEMQYIEFDEEKDIRGTINILNDEQMKNNGDAWNYEAVLDYLRQHQKIHDYKFMEADLTFNY